MSLFTKSYPWLAVSLLSVSSLIGLNNQNCPPYKDSRGKDTQEAKCAPAPSCEPVCKPVCQPKCPPKPCCTTGCWDLIVRGSFIYWQPLQENMELGIVTDTTDSLYSVHGHEVNLDTDYKPGFKVGIGMNFPDNNWDTMIDYTWFHGNQNKNVSLVFDGPEVLLPAWLIPDVTAPSYFAAREEWRLHMDLLDWTIGKKCCCSGVSFYPFFGARAAWIRQNVEVDYMEESTGSLFQESVFLTQRSHSWGLGLRSGLNASWMFGEHFRVYGEGSGDILFTQYTNQRFHQEGTTAAGVLSTGSLFTVRQKDVNYLRSHLDLELGLGWGTGFCDSCWHLDLSASYGFQVFFDQNMFRNYVDNRNFAKSIAPNGNLYIHGLTTTLRLDF